MVGFPRLAALAISILAPLSSSAPTNGDADVPTAVLVPANNGAVNAENFNCYNACYGISRDTVVQALDWFCQQFEGHVLKAPADNLWGRYQYKPNTDTTYLGPYDEGEIVMTINVTSNAECSPSLTMTYDACFTYSLVPIDNCNTASAEGKQGGTVLYGCLQYEFQPNPKYWPECALEPQEQSKSIDMRAADVSITPDPTYLNCYNLCFGVERGRAIDAVNFFCNKAAGRTFTTSVDNFAQHYLYETHGESQDPGYYNEGDIRMSINVTDGVKCNPGVTMTFDECYANVMYSCVDGCNTDGENHKQGGWSANGCLKYEFQPNPVYWPFCYFGPDQRGSGSRVVHADNATSPNSTHKVFGAYTTTMTQSLPTGAPAAMSTEPPQAPSGLNNFNIEDDAESLYCFNSCFGVSRAVMGDATNAFCNWMGDHYFTFAETSNMVLTWNYPPAEPWRSQFGEYYEEGRVDVHIEVIEGAVCSPTVFVNYGACYQRLMWGLVDRCGTEDENYKRGGWVTHGCLNYTVQPNPLYWPACGGRPSSVSKFETAADMLSDDASAVQASGSAQPQHGTLLATSIAPRSEPLSFTTLGLEGTDWPDPTCLNNCYGVSRIIAGVAANEMSVQTGGRNFTTPEDNVELAWSYEPNRQELFQGPGWIEEGSILMTIEVIPGTTCDPPMFIDNPNIYRVFMWNIIDKCNTGGENHKQGGYLTNGCLNFNINPNPKYWPDCELAPDARKALSPAEDETVTFSADRSAPPHSSTEGSSFTAKPVSQ